MSDTATVVAAPTTVPPQRAAEPTPAPRKERPASEFWDAEECCWRQAGISPGVPAAG